jgi:CubicO group peptidase (beta-lactamase class C family)
MPMNTPALSPQMTRRQWLGGAAAVGAASAVRSTPAFAQRGFGWPSVTRLVERYVDARKVSGMVAALGFRQREPAFIARGYDTFAKPRLSDGDSLYRIYSMTKPITGMAAMMLIDEGKLGLDQPLYENLRAF